MDTLLLDNIFVGTELKYIVEIEADGFDMMENEFTVDIIRGPKTIHFEKSDLEIDADDNWYVCFDTADLGPGVVTAKITAYVPDSDYQDGLRTEVEKVQIAYIKP